jgi:magnesium transporter
MTKSPLSEQHRHHNLEQSRAEIIELLSRQALEMTVVNRWQQPGQDLVTQLTELQHRTAIGQRLSRFHPADVAFVLESLDPGARDIAWGLVRPQNRGAVLLEISASVRRALVQDMPASEIAALASPLAAEDVAMLIADLPAEIRQQVLDTLDGPERAEVTSVLSFPKGSVGAAMDREFIAVPVDATLSDVQRSLRLQKAIAAQTTQLFVVDDKQRPLGLLALAKLLQSDPDERVRDAMSELAAVFHTDEPMRDVVHAFEMYDLVTAPVVNLHDHIVGRVTVDAVVDELNERAQSDNLRQVGLTRDDEDLFSPARQAARRRWPWIAINLCTAFLASRVINAFGQIIEQLVALAALMPIVASLGGNAGQQSVALLTQRLTMGKLGPGELQRVLLRELKVGAINGALYAVVLALITLSLYGDAQLALVIAAALLLNLMLAASVGVLAPSLLAKFGRDPVMGSSVILTASTDFMGYLLFLGLAATFLI